MIPQQVCDLHCDTLYEMYKRQLPFDNDLLHLTARTTAGFGFWRQVFAVWSEHGLSEEEAFAQFLAVLRYKETLAFPPRLSPILAVEGGKLLGGILKRVEILRDAGVKILTLVWQDHCCMGGAWNTGDGLTPFGREAVERCFECGIVPDLSHASDPMAEEVIAMALERGKPVIASHSNARAVCEHPRNLTDALFSGILRTGGIVGISLCARHLCKEPPCTLRHVVAHILHGLALGGEEALCLGCDFDGITEGPAEIKNAGDLCKIADALSLAGVSSRQIDRLFFENAERFFAENGICPPPPAFTSSFA